MDRRTRSPSPRGSILMLVLPLGLVVFVTAMFMAQRGGALRNELVLQRDHHRARRLAASALAEGLAAGHRKIMAVVAARGSLAPPNHDLLLRQLQGQRWDVPADLCRFDNPEPAVFSVLSISAAVADDTPIHPAHVGDIEVTARVAVTRHGQPQRIVQLHERWAFRIGDGTLRVVLCRRPLRRQLFVESEGDGP